MASNIDPLIRGIYYAYLDVGIPMLDTEPIGVMGKIAHEHNKLRDWRYSWSTMITFKELFVRELTGGS